MTPSQDNNSNKSNTNGGGMFQFRFWFKWIILPFTIGCILSDFLPQEIADRAVDILLYYPKSMLECSSNQTSTLPLESSSQPLNPSTDTVPEMQEISEEEDDDDDEEEEERDAISRALGDGDLCFQRLLKSMAKEDAQVANHLMTAATTTTAQEEDPVGDSGVILVMHRNGDSEGCGVSVDFLTQLRMALLHLPECPVAFTKYQVESILSSTFHTMFTFCDSQESIENRTGEEGFLGYCDMGEDKTPVLLDHDKLIPVATSPDPDAPTFLPCHFHSREGVRMTSFQKLMQAIVDKYKEVPQEICEEAEDGMQYCYFDDKEVHLYAVPAGRTFMFAPSYVGETFDLPHIQGADPDKPVYMKVLSVSPRVFDIFNYFTRDESQGLVDKAIAEKSDSHRMKRSSTGASGYNMNTRRTSENGFDTHGKTAQAVKRRCFSVLGFDEYIESHSDGLQILRYNQTKAYTAHMDWIDDDGQQDHNYNSAGKGGNRFATILLYMTDLGPGDGGETVFVNAPSIEENPKTYKEALKELRESEHAKLFKRDSWEENMVAKCRSSLAVVPNSARAVLFYSQLPNGEPDPASLHGGCPVLTETPKWAANLWVWNTPRAGFDGAPMNEKRMAEKRARGEDVPTSTAPPKKRVTFANENGKEEFANAELFYEDSFWAKLGEGDPPQAVNSYEGQIWNIQVDGKVVRTWQVGKPEKQKYTI